MQKMGWFGVVRGHSKSTAMSPFDRAHTTSYSTLIETMRLAPENYSPCGIVRFCLRDPTFCDFSRTPACDRQTQTDTGPWLVPRMHSIAR